MKNINIFTFLAVTLSLIGFSINFVYAQPSTAYVIPIHTDAYTPGEYMGGAHVIGSGDFANRLQSGLSSSANQFGIRTKPGVGTTAVTQANKTLSVAQNAGVTNSALIEVGAHRLLLDQYGTPSGVANSPYVTNLIDNVIAPNVGNSGKIIIPMDHTRKQIPDTPGGNTFQNANATGAAEYKGYSERDVTDAIAARIKAKFGDRVVIIKPEDYTSYQEYDNAIISAVGGTATTDSTTSSSTSSTSTTAGNVSYQSYTNFPGVGRISDLCQLINALWLLGFAVLLTSVLGMFLYGGYIYVTAGVNAGQVNQAKEIFTNTITGLIIGLSIFIIINVINPGLLQGNCSIPPIGSTGTGANQPTLGGEPYTGGPTASVVDVGRFIESRMGLRVREHSAWNGGRPITGGHSNGSLHYQDKALDITDWRSPGEAESVWKPRMRALERAWTPIAQKYGIQMYGPDSDPRGHGEHIHLGFPSGSVSSAALDEMLAAERQVLQQHPLR
jgi:hypothetical protein